MPRNAGLRKTGSRVPERAPRREANAIAADALVEELARSGIRHVCLSPGSRSAPLVLALSRCPGLRHWVITDERSAGFFALGLARESGRPVAVLCTSGTAAANLLPAVAEASLGNVPLVVLTADRPPELRDFGAAQTIHQHGLYGAHTRWSADAATPAGDAGLETYWRALAARAVAEASADPPGPVHLNLPFREPLFDPGAEAAAPRLDADAPPQVVVHRARAVASADALERIAATFAVEPRGLIVCGEGGGEPAAVAALAAALEWPVLADPLSGLRFGAHDRSRVIDAYDLLLRDETFVAANAPGAVVRLGRLPASKPLERFLGTTGGRHLLVAPRGTWPDPLHRATDLLQAEATAFCSDLVARVKRRSDASGWMAVWRAASDSVRAAIDHELEQEPGLSEGGAIAAVVRALPEGAALHVGNSMPIREADTFLGNARKRLSVVANRGANGIDGVVSTALGAAAAGGRPVALVVGDLSFLHDVGALQIAARHRIALPVVVLDNDGGGIFSFLPQAGLAPGTEALFSTPHGLDLAGLVPQARRVPDVRALEERVRECLASGRFEVLVVPGDRAGNLARHREVVAAALVALRPRGNAAGGAS